MVIPLKSAALFRTLCTIRERESWRREKCFGNCWTVFRGLGLVSNSTAAVAGSFSMTCNLVPPLCVSGIGLTLGSEMLAVFGRGNVTGFTNQIVGDHFCFSWQT